MSRDSRRNELEISQLKTKFLEILLDATLDGIVITDASQNIILTNKAFSGFFDLKRQEMLETSLISWIKQFSPNAADQWNELEKRVHRDGSCSGIEFKVTRNGEKRFFKVNASLLEHEEAAEKGSMVSVWRDITERKQTEGSMEEARARQEFSTDLLTHDLTNVFQGLLSLLELVLMEPALSTKVTQLVQNALKQLNRGVDMVTQMKIFMRRENPPES